MIRKLLNSWLFWFILVLVAAGIIYRLAYGDEFNSTVTNQLLDQQLILTRAEVSNTKLFFEKFGNSTVGLASLISIESANQTLLNQELKIFTEERKEMGIVGGVGLLDSKGTVIANYNTGHTDERGKSAAGRDYFSYTRDHVKAGEYYISNSFVSSGGVTKNQDIVAVSSPIYNNGKFNGMVSASLKLKEMMEKFFSLMPVSMDTQAYLFDTNGNILYTRTSPTLTGKNIHDINIDSGFIPKIDSVLGKGQDGKFVTARYLVAYVPVDLGSQKWLLVTLTGLGSVNAAEQPYIFHRIAFAIPIILILIFIWLMLHQNRPQLKTSEK